MSSSPLDAVVRFPSTSLEAANSSSVKKPSAAVSMGLRRSATTSTCLRGRDQFHSQRQRGSGGSNSQWDLGNKTSTARPNMFLQENAAMSREGSSASLKSCISMGSMDGKKKSPGMKKNVSFETVSIREHPLTVGDNPCVSAGPPVSLGWYNEETCNTTTLPLEEYEGERPVRRNTEEIARLSRPMRESLLQDLGGATSKEMMKATLEANRAKKERLQTLKKISKGGDQQQLAMEKAKRKVQRLVGVKKSSKEEQEELWKRAANYRAQTQSLSAIPEMSQSLPVFQGRSSQQQQGSSKNAVW